jgi:cysteine synthase A
MQSYFQTLSPTPLVPIVLQPGAPAIWCKLEFLNPSGSTKDRIARHILEKARRRGQLKPGDLVVEASSGSTSIALALACAQMGLRFLAFIPESATNERSLMIQAYGGEVRKVPGGMLQVIAAADAFAAANRAFPARQFENPDNAEAHRLFTAHEILAQLPVPRIDAVVSGVGTGGTLVGLHAGLVDAGCAPVPVAAIPRSTDTLQSNAECCSVSFSKHVPGVVEGCSKIYARWKDSPAAAGLREIAVEDARCLELTRQLWAQGFPVGPSSGLNLAAALDVAAQLKTDGDPVIVTVLPDRMERYFSHKVFDTLRPPSA